ncbi:hypothetical protein GDO81_001247 [Engystomops pustulosus]|uniref:THAP-type domain-containing protein n=1 Tax=Engystomops pustulosus TaxID=76066 RepID=A0AAV7DD42_ENGPU|nr:hypothetical protein GDO81_001247 [Engystomops pustulosus]KAG8594556.1 hypothetical protein GDO81_001247 [Engystomops pustulosus]
MPMTCVAYGCHNHFVKGCGKQFFRFPLKDPDRLSNWVMAIRRKNWKPSASSRICSDHFTENDYMLRPGAMVPRLRLDAVPSVFDGFPTHLKERLERKKTLKKEIDDQIIVICNHHGPQDAVRETFDSEEPNNRDVACKNSESNSVQVRKFPTQEIEQDKARNQYQKNEVDKVKTCAVHGCNNTYYEGCQQLFFRFPINDPALLSKWVVAIHHENYTKSESLTSYSVCSKHFTEKDYILYPGATVPELGPNAVPSLFIKLPTEIPTALESQEHQTDSIQMTVPEKQSKDQILIPSEIGNTKLHEKSNKESLSEHKQQVKHGPSVSSHPVTCVVDGCYRIFVKGCGKRFFRFPMKNPERLSKWLKALQCSPEWKPSASSRICSDHFRDKDYIVRLGTLERRLRISAVPSVFKARKSRRKQIIESDQNLRHHRSLVDEFLEEIKSCDHTYSAAHNEESLPRFNPNTVKLKKKVKTLQRQIQRQRHTIKKLSERIAQLKNNNAPLHQR